MFVFSVSLLCASYRSFMGGFVKHLMDNRNLKIKFPRFDSFFKSQWGI